MENRIRYTLLIDIFLGIFITYDLEFKLKIGIHDHIPQKDSRIYEDRQGS